MVLTRGHDREGPKNEGREEKRPGHSAERTIPQFYRARSGLGRRLMAIGRQTFKNGVLGSGDD
jgi:hypothetical protein